MHKEFKTLFRYGLVGLANTGVFTLCASFLSRSGLHYAIYTAISYGIAIIFSFLMNRIFTFRQSKQQALLKSFLRFLLVTLILLGSVQIIQYVLIDGAGWSEFAGIVTGMVFYTGVGYTVNRLWVFRLV